MIDAVLRDSLAGFDDAALALLANPGLVRRAHRDVREGKLRLVSAKSGGAVVEADGQRVTLDRSGPRAAFCTCRSFALCRHRIAAVLFLRPRETARATGKAADSDARVKTVEVARTAAPDAIKVDSAFLDRVAASLCEVAALGFNLAPLPVEESLFELSVSSRVDSLPRLSAQLRAIAAQMRLRRQRALAFDPERMLELAATAFALTRALARGDPQRLAGLAGTVRRDFAASAPLRLVGCGGERWRSDTGARGVTAWFIEPESGRWLSTTLARGAGQDPAFNPGGAWRAQPMWQAEPLAVLAHARIELQGAGCSRDGRLSAPASARATIGARDVRPDPAWPGVVRDWHDLRAAWLRETGLGLDAVETPVACLLAPTAVAPPQFDDLAQQLVWPVQDTSGAWLGLTLDHGQPGSAALEALEATVRTDGQGMLLVRLARAGDSLQARPLTLFGNAQAIDLTLGHPCPARSTAPSAGVARDRLARIGTIGGEHLAWAPRNRTDTSLAMAWRRLLDQAETGPALAPAWPGGPKGGIAADAERLDELGLPALAGLMREAGTAAGLLAASYGLLVARQQRCALPLLR